MRARTASAVVVAFLLMVAGGARAESPQQAASAQAPVEAQVQPQPQAPSADSQFRALGVSLDRIRRQLRELPPTKAESLLRLDYHIEVVGKMPPIDLLGGFNISKTSAVPYGGMTHAEFLKIVSPPWRKW